jgi:hypothetical protein
MIAIPDFIDHDDKVPARFCPWVHRCRPGQFWNYPEDTFRGIPTYSLDVLESLVRLQPRTQEDSIARYNKILRCMIDIFSESSARLVFYQRSEVVTHC